MVRYRRCGAVIDIYAGIQGLELELRFLARRDLRRSGPTAGPRHRVEVDAMGHLAVGRVLERHLDGIPLADPDHRTRHRTAKSPEGVGDTVIQQGCYLFGLDLDGDEGWSRAVQRRCYLGLR